AAWMYVARYKADGTLAWAKTASGGQNGATSVASLADGGVLVAGTLTGNQSTTIFGAAEPNQTALPNLRDSDPTTFLARYAADGSLVWARASAVETWPMKVAVLPDGSFLVTGVFGDPYAPATSVTTSTFGAGEPNE